MYVSEQCECQGSGHKGVLDVAGVESSVFNAHRSGARRQVRVQVGCFLCTRAGRLNAWSAKAMNDGFCFCYCSLTYWIDFNLHFPLTVNTLAFVYMPFDNHLDKHMGTRFIGSPYLWKNGRTHSSHAE